MTFLKRCIASNIYSIRKFISRTVISTIAFSLEMLTPNNDGKNSKLFLSLLISFKNKNKMQNCKAIQGKKKSSRQDFKGYSNCPNQCFLLSLANHVGWSLSSLLIILSPPTNYLPDETISIIHQVEAFGCPVLPLILGRQSYEETI